ncbi:hypothetical protein NDU88_003112 [Pleurodeles waltl]|uniref:Uncharacterized protein n=1 Tax=Pleurodeles waltl TaxID=8319 RepID=A0AAV7KTY8_PLEWA|nr:hypothetical protein NDU88_003112 [Pleurodeles waltl]
MYVRCEGPLDTEMVSQCSTKKDGPLKDLFAKTPVKKADLHKDNPTTTGDMDEEAAPFTLFFLEQLFGVLRDDFVTLKQEIATEVKDLRRDMGELGHRVDSLEQKHESCEKEMEAHHRELLEMQDKNLAVQYQLEDLESRC